MGHNGEVPPFRVGDMVQTRPGGSKEGRSGQIHEMQGERALVLFQGCGSTEQVATADLEFVPKRFGGLLTKYSTQGRLVRNWKTRWVEVWSDSLTYRAEGTTKVLGGVVLTRQSEIVTDGKISAQGDRFKGDPPHPFYCGVYDRGKTLWLSCPTEEMLTSFKVAIQDAINASATRDPDEMTTSLQPGGGRCSIQ